MTAPQILIVEDERSVAEDIRASLEQKGYGIVGVASSGEQAILEAEGGQPDLILMDINLQGSMDGTQAAKHIRHALDVPVVFLTAYSDGTTLEKAKAGEPYGYIIKPFEDRELFSTIEIALHKHQMERKLRASERRFRAMVSNAVDGIVIVSAPGVVCFANRMAENLFGRPANDQVGESWPYPLANGTTELLTTPGSGDTRLVEMRPIEIEWDGEPGYLVTLRDITERARLQQELETSRQEELAMKDRFLSHVSHELRTPLAVIYEFVTILLDGLAGDLGADQVEYLDITLKNVNQLRTMVADLLEVSRVQTGKLAIDLQDASICELVDETAKAMHMVAVGKGITLRADVPKSLPAIYADPSRIRQVLNNLVDNAIKFTPSGGSVTVKARLYEEDARFVVVLVADTGCGIGAADRDRVFDRLYQTDQAVASSRRGLGLGLYICKEWVARHGGKIWVESELARGSTFGFTLPLLSSRELEGVDAVNVGPVVEEGVRRPAGGPAEGG